MKNGFILSAVFDVELEVLFKAWLDSKEHSKFTGSPAKISPKVGGKFSAWDGYITGETTEIDKNHKIVQQWRTTEFPDSSPDSILMLTFEKAKNGTKLISKHTRIPEGQADEYRQGWEEFYFEPMKKYFSK
jgi:activator of HSP90 ATPase